MRGRRARMADPESRRRSVFSASLAWVQCAAINLSGCRRPYRATGLSGDLYDAAYEYVGLSKPGLVILSGRTTDFCSLVEPGHGRLFIDVIQLGGKIGALLASPAFVIRTRLIDIAPGSANRAFPRHHPRSACRPPRPLVRS